MKPERYERYGGGLLLCAIALMAWPGGLPLPASAGLWSALIVAVCRFIPRIRVPADASVRGTALAYAFLGAACYVAALYSAGVVLEMLAASPYDRSPLGLLVNMARVLPPIIGRELVRGYSFGAAWRVCKHRRAAVVLLTVLFFLAELRMARILTLTGVQAVVAYTAQTIAPALARGVLLSVLVFYGGPGAGIVYGTIPAVFEWAFPFLPNLPWLAQGAVGVCVPLVLAMVASDRFGAQKRGGRAAKERGMAGFGIGLAASVLFAWFVVGVFPVYPSVVLTGSMEPMVYPGDAVLIHKLTREEELSRLAAGDVINFKRENITITHRIIAVLKDEAGNLSFQTKGDNNDSPDVQLVHPNDINGTVRHVVPKVGLPILMTRSGQDVPEGVLDGD